MSGWALISVCCWNQDRFHWQNLDDTIDGIIKSPPQVLALRRHLIRCDGKLPREHFHRVDLAEIFRTHTLFCQTEPWRSISRHISSTKCKATCKKSTGYHPNPIKNLRNPQQRTRHLFPDAPPPLPPPTRTHLLQAKAAKERADAAVEKEAAEKAAAEAIVYIKCPHCRHLGYIFWRMSGWALISVRCWNQDRFHWQNLDDTMDGITKSPPQIPALR